ncbi:hypothetical protein CAEBREN_14861 [Caenorhabditis brenneri]|uniref:F-box domain-containing protein n=1 Tax=Caenorhabditis brenneri TaxID=135651 RepID=G0N1M3_CAEBE|nr:hypothetical protein CAEBREN_14861 [Caenorhabditis brenneri]
MSSLLEMTDVPMRNILEKCDFKSVLTLRKVCHSLRNFIDDTCFKTDLDNICITIGPNGFSVTCSNPDPFWLHGIEFAKDCTSNDLKIILKLVQNSQLSYFLVTTNPDNVGGLDDLEEILKNQTRPLHTERFVMEGSGILKILPYFDSKALKKISILPINYGTNGQNLVGIEKFLELEQFKNAMELYINNWFVVRADLSKFFHFQRVRVKLHETSLEEHVALKEAFVTSTHMKFFELHSHGLDENKLEQVFGTPFHDHPLGYSQWFFEIQNCKEHVLRIDFAFGGIGFRKLETKKVPQDAVVQR